MVRQAIIPMSISHLVKQMQAKLFLPPTAEVLAYKAQALQVGAQAEEGAVLVALVPVVLLAQAGTVAVLPFKAPRKETR